MNAVIVNPKSRKIISKGEKVLNCNCLLTILWLSSKLLCVYTLVNSRLFSHQVVSQGNIYYPITTTMPMSPMCEAVFTCIPCSPERLYGFVFTVVPPTGHWCHFPNVSNYTRGLIVVFSAVLMYFVPQ